MKAIVLGLMSSFFFASSFVLNRMMSVGGGSWLWTASLRYLFMIPFLLVIVAMRRKLRALFVEMFKHPIRWLLWSTVGFGVFYAPLCFAAAYSPAWLVAATWQFTIVAGSLLVPFFYTTVHTEAGIQRVRMKIPMRGIGVSIVILIGILLMEIEQAGNVPMRDIWLGAVPVVIASFAYPLGNRKMMELCNGRVGTVERVLGMTLASLPLWIVLCAVGTVKVGLPPSSQVVQSLIVAISSGVIATALFFRATDATGGNVHQLAAVEATQAGEVVFTLLGELVLIPGTFISQWSLAGMGIVIIGMVMHSFTSVVKTRRRETASSIESM